MSEFCHARETGQGLELRDKIRGFLRVPMANTMVRSQDPLGEVLATSTAPPNSLSKEMWV